MGEKPSGNLGNPAIAGRLKHYPRPTQQYSQRPQPQVLSDVADQFSKIYQTNVNGITKPAQRPVAQQPLQQTTQQIPLQAPSSFQSQPAPVVTRQQYQQPAPQPSTMPQPLAPVQYQQPTRSQYNQAQYQQPVPQQYKELAAAQYQQPVAEHFTPELLQEQINPQQNMVAPIYLNNYDGEYEDPKPKRFSRSGSHKKGPLVLISSFASVMVLIIAFVVFMNWNNNRGVVQAQSSAPSQSTKSDNRASTQGGNFASSIEPTTEQVASYTVGPSLPRYLIIPKLNIMNMIKPVNLNAKNFLNAPDNIYNVGWWQASSVPGQAGATVLDGFTTNGIQNGVFKLLNQLAPGDIFVIQKGDNTKITYKVVRSTEFGTHGLTMDQAISPVTNTKPGLNIITCSGQSTTCPSSSNFDFVLFAEQE